MSRQQADPIAPAAREAFLVDADFHVNADVDDLLDYIETPIIAEKLEAGLDHQAHPHWPPRVELKSNVSGRATLGIANNGEDILEAKEEVGVDLPIVTPSIGSISLIQYPYVKNEICSAYNDFLLEEVTSADDSIKGLAIMPQWDPDAMVDELERIGNEEDIVGAYGWNSVWSMLGDQAYDDVYETLVDLDLPWMLHGAGGAWWDRFDPIGDGFRSWNEVWGIVTPSLAMIQASNMVLTGVFDTFPDLKMVIAEAGVTWLPFVARRLDDFYQIHSEDLKLAERYLDEGKDYLDRLPSEYLFDNFYFATQPINLPKQTKNLEAVLDMCHARDTFVFSSDWPHCTFDPPNWVVESPAIDAEMRERIFHGNAQEAFRL